MPISLSAIAPPPEPGPWPELVPASSGMDPAANARYFALLGTLRRIGAEAMNIQTCAQHIIDAAQIVDPKLRTSAVRAAAEEQLPLITESASIIHTFLAIANEDTERHPFLNDLCGDVIQKIAIYTRSITADLSDPGGSVDEIVKDAKRIANDAQMVLFHVGLATIPSRINQHLASVRIGKGISFHDTFRDEVPYERDRTSILQYLADHPAAVDGIVHVAAGVIQRASPNPRRRIGCYLLILGAIAVLAIASYALGRWEDEIGIPGFPDGISGSRMLLGSLAAFIGGFVHLLIDGVKQLKDARLRGESSPYAISDWLLWLHVNELAVVATVVGVWIAFLGIVLTLDRVEFVVMFLAGYSSDSFMDLFLQRFSTAVSTREAAIRESVT